jgi:hypothetical protein
MKITLIKDGVVENIAEVESLEKANQLFSKYYTVKVTGNEQIGYLFDGVKFTPPQQEGV